MKNLRTYLAALPLLAAGFLFTACGGDDDDNGGGGGGVTPQPYTRNVNANPKNKPEYARLEMPRIKTTGTTILIHKTADTYDKDGVNFIIEWDNSKKAQRYTAYQMHKGYSGSSGRTDAWAEDPEIPMAYRFSNSSSMYSGSGYTRGHILPSADRTFSKAANEQTFYFSNMQPQYYNFNAGDGYTGAWVIMENQLRKWTNALGANDTIFVVKGGTIDDDKIIEKAKGQLIVPKYFFVALLKKNSSGYSSLGMWFEHTKDVIPNIHLADYCLSIDELEKKTGIDFFCNLPDEEEDKVEKAFALKTWGLN